MLYQYYKLILVDLLMGQALYYCPLFKNEKFHAQKAPPTLQKETSSLGKAESGTWVL